MKSKRNYYSSENGFGEDFISYFLNFSLPKEDRLARDNARENVSGTRSRVSQTCSPTQAAATTVKGMEAIMLQTTCTGARREQAAGDINGCLVKALTTADRDLADTRAAPLRMQSPPADPMHRTVKNN